jgi:hypothetical protein
MPTSGKKEAGQPSSPTNPSGTSGTGDFGYVEFALEVHHKLGRIEEAVETLKGTSKEHSDKLEALGKDIYAAKAVLKVGAWVIGISVPLVGAIVALLNHFWK